MLPESSQQKSRFGQLFRNQSERGNQIVHLLILIAKGLDFSLLSLQLLPPRQIAVRRFLTHLSAADVLTHHTAI